MRCVLKADNGHLQKISLDKELSQIQNQQNKKIDNWYHNEDGIVVYNGTNYKLFAPYQLPQHSDINLLTLNNKLETVKYQCVYQFLPLEEAANENLIRLKYATILNSEWWILFRQENNLRYVREVNSRYAVIKTKRLKLVAPD